ncbi:MAG: transketolase [Planctomycetota bacterium]|nr:transketolase [Planctomycetota bacterium]
MADYKDLDRKVIKLSKQIVKMCTAAGSGHPSSALALVHITTALMYRVMRYDPSNPWNAASDRLVLSEGHAVPVIYAAYCELGGAAGTKDLPINLTFADCLTLREGSSCLDGHPNPARKFPFFDAATGSLGQGLSVAAGLAGAARLDRSDKKIFCLVGDGEAREGQIWEAIDFIVDHKLTAVRTVFNCNGQAQSDYVSPQQSAETLAAKLAAYNMDVRVIDGHNFEQIFEALTAKAGDKPIAIIAKTVKGWGVTELQKHTYHGKPLTEAQLPQAYADLDAKAAELGVADVEDGPVAKLTTPAVPKAIERMRRISAGPFAQALTTAGYAKALEAKALSTRQAYGAALLALGTDDRIVATDGDVKNSTFADLFAKKYPERFFEARIAEQNMVSAAVGLAAGGKIPFASTFGKFFTRAYDQIEMATITNANIKMAGSHSGVSLASDGPSQMALSDLAFFRAFAHAKRVDGQPACRLFQPSDAVSAFKLTEMMANTDGMCYMRTHRPTVAFLYDESESFGPEGYKHLIDGQDLVIVASGYMVSIAQQAITLLEETAGLSAGLVDVYAMPLQTDEILRIGDDCRGQILVLEDNYLGGFADEITRAAAASDYGLMVTTMFADHAPKSAKTPEETLAMCGLSPQDIVATAQKMFDQSA